ncbi:hypothetical protein F5887DRAFT_840862, partial [Amanita rubescens]
PADLVEPIVDFLWSFRLSIDERIAFMTSMPLFNSTWRKAYIHASIKDVYIPCSSYTSHFLSVLRRESEFYDEGTRACFEARCRSINFVIDHPLAPQNGFMEDHPAGMAMADVLRFISNNKCSYLPNLRKIAIHYHNMGFDDIFNHSRFVDFPSQVIELEIIHTFSPEVDSGLQNEEDHNPLSFSWHIPNIRHLTLAGVGCHYVANMVAICPNIVDLELDLTYGPLREIRFIAPNSLQRL